LKLSTSQRQVLIGLLSSGSPVSASEIGRALGLSASTIRRQLPAIELWLNKMNGSLIRETGGRLGVAYGVHSKEEFLKALAEQDSPAGGLGQKERFDLLTFLLHTSAQPRITQDFQDLLQVSRSTILDDLAEIAAWYEARHLFLVRRPNFGVKLMGKESDWRKTFIELILRHFDEPTLFHFCGHSGASNQALSLINPALASLITTYLAGLELQKARELVRLAESKLRTRFADSDHLVLTLHIALLIKRVAEQNIIEMNPAQLQTLVGQPAYRVACELAHQIQETYGLIAPQSEVGHLAIQLLGAKLDTRALGEPPSEAEDLAYALLTRASALLDRPLDEDRELILRLAAHLAPTLHRMMRDLPIRNPLLDDIRTRYPQVYGAAQTASLVIRDYLGKEVPEDEVAYIAMYLAGALMRYDELRHLRALIVCPSGSATSWLLHSRLKQEFPEIQVMDICSTRDLQRGIPRNIDLVISTVPLSLSSAQLVVVSALLSAKDIQKIHITIEALQCGTREARQAS
jgi:transcriptional antiterminator